MKNNNEVSKVNYVNGSVAYGYNYNGPKLPYSIDADKAFMVKLIFRLYALGNMSPRAIAEHLNNSEIFKRTKKSKKWTDKAIRQVLTNEVYVGTYVFNKRRTDPITGTRHCVSKEHWCRAENQHEPIVSKEVFDYAQEIYQLRSSNPFSVKQLNEAVIDYLNDNDTQVELARLLLTEFIHHDNFAHYVREKIFEQNGEDFSYMYQDELNGCIDESDVLERTRSKALRMLGRL